MRADERETGSMAARRADSTLGRGGERGGERADGRAWRWRAKRRTARPRQRDFADRGVREDIEQRPLALLPNPEHPAGRLQAALLGALDAEIESDRTLDRFDNVAEGDRFGRTGELIAAAGTAPRPDQPAAHQVADDLFEIILRDMFGAGDFGTASDALGIVGQMDHGAQGVFDLARNLHQAHSASPGAAAESRAAARLRPLAWAGPRIRSTYLTSMSLSTLTRAPGPLRPSVVILSVWGISATEKRRPLMLKTVRLTPSSVTEPF